MNFFRILEEKHNFHYFLPIQVQVSNRKKFQENATTFNSEEQYEQQGNQLIHLL